MSRPRTGSLYWAKSGWRARLTVEVDGESVQKSFDLGTTNKAAARIKLRRLIASVTGATPEEAKREETFAEACERLVPAQDVKTHAERLSRLRRYAFPEIGSVLVTEIRASHVRDVLEGAVRAELSRQSVVHLRNDMGSVLGRLWRDEQIAENPVARVRMKDLEVKPKQDKRPRVVLSDGEFAALMACPDVPEHLALMALTSRAFGGMRTSDLHAWDWSHVDTATFASAEVYRPKTDGGEDDAEAVLEELVIPDVLRGPLRAWWSRWRATFRPLDAEQGPPTEGPVFPVMAGKRAGERQAKRSHARELRAAVWAAGAHRPLPGFAEALAAMQDAARAIEGAKAKGRAAWWQAKRDRRLAEEEAKALDAMQTNTKRTRALDFHSMRRQYNTALAAAGVNVQTAMALAGHKNPKTHMRYVDLAQLGPMEQPANAMPLLPPAAPANVSASPMLKLASGSDLSIGDPNETRTRVTGVRVSREEAHPTTNAANVADSSGAETHRDMLKQDQCRLAMQKPLLDAALADAVLGMALLGCADRAALALVRDIVGG